MNYTQGFFIDRLLRYSGETMELKRKAHVLAPLILLAAFSYVSLAWNHAVETHFFVPLGLFLLFGFGVGTWANKRIVGEPSRTSRFFLQYIFTFLIAIVFALFTGTFSWDPRMLIVFCIGVFQCMGTFARWKANDISLAQTSLFTYWDDLIPMALSAIFLHELSFFTPFMWAGVSTCIGVTIYFVRGNFRYVEGRVGKKSLSREDHIRLIALIAFYSVVWGVAMFSQKVFAAEELRPGHWGLAWYAGSLVTASVIYFCYKDPSANQQGSVGIRNLSRHNVLFMFYLASITVLCLMLGHVVLRTTPQNLSQPIMMIGEAVGGIWIGVRFFGEGRHFTKGERIAMKVGLFGIVLIGLATYFKI